MTPSQLLDISIDDNIVIPKFSAFCANISENEKGDHIGYLQLVPSSPTKPAVVKTMMSQLMKITRSVEMDYTIITCDLAVYEIAYALRQNH